MIVKYLNKPVQVGATLVPAKSPVTIVGQKNDLITVSYDTEVKENNVKYKLVFLVNKEDLGDE